MIIVIRILFGFATFFIISFLTILIAKIICRYDDKPSCRGSGQSEYIQSA